jgi:hypothetical protein
MLGASTSLQEQACLVPYLTYWAPAGPFHSSTQEPHNLITSFQITNWTRAVLRILVFCGNWTQLLLRKTNTRPHSDSNFKPAVKFTSVVQVSTFEHTRLVLVSGFLFIYFQYLAGTLYQVPVEIVIPVGYWYYGQGGLLPGIWQV